MRHTSECSHHHTMNTCTMYVLLFLLSSRWTSFGVFLSSLLTLPFIEGTKYPSSVVGWGIISGGLFVCAVAFSFVAVQLIGLSIAQGIWSGVAVVVSFVWGVAALGDVVNPAIAAVGVTLIVIGVVGIATCGEITARLFPGSIVPPTSTMHGRRKVGLREELLDEPGDTTPPHRLSIDDLDPHVVHPALVRAQSQSAAAAAARRNTDFVPGDVNESSVSATSESVSGHHSFGSTDSWLRQQEARFDRASSFSTSIMTSLEMTADHDLSVGARASLQRQRMGYGLICALIVGLFGGSILMPLQLAPRAQRGLDFVPSFGLGTLIVAPVITLPYMWLSRSSGSRGHWAVRESLLPGLAAGAMWNGANICSIYAIPRIGYAVAYPLMQCAVVVAAMWGVIVFKEIRGRQVAVMAGAGGILLVGAALLAVSK